MKALLLRSARICGAFSLVAKNNTLDYFRADGIPIASEVRTLFT